MIRIFDSEVLGAKNLNPSVRYLKLSVPEDFNFKPGQYVSLSVFRDGKKIRRPFSIASPKNSKNYIELCIKLIEGNKTSEFIKKLNKGDNVELFGPIGNFIVNDLNKDLIFLSSGTGISAFISMIPTILNTGFKNKIILLKAFRDESEILYEKEFSGLEIKHKNFKFYNVLSQPKNKNFENKEHIQDFLKKYIPENFKGDFYICGLSDMIMSVKEKLISLGFPEEGIFYEKYD